MSFSATIAQVVDAIAAVAVNISGELLGQVCTGIQTDTRILKTGEIFVALRGERFDGHDFVEMAIERGAVAVIVDHDFPACEFPMLRVGDTLTAYQQLGRWWRDRFDIPVIGVTGSVGKTTTKELIAAVLATQGRVHKTYANFNNEIGVPKTLLELGEEHDFAVIEMAMRGRGQIAELTEIARPTIGVITNVGTAHIELLGSEAAIAEAKCELLGHMATDSVAILNYDQPLLVETSQRVWNGRVVSYGLNQGDICGSLIDGEQIQVAGKSFKLPLPGKHNATNYLAALAVAQVLNIDWDTLADGVTVDMPSGRSQRYKLPNDVIILDETYNAAPEAMLAALDMLAETPGKRRIAVLGAMKELGDRSLQLHAHIGETASKLNLDALLVLVDGRDAKEILNHAKGITSECFTSHADLVERLKNYVQSGDRLMFKAAHSVGLDRVVNQLRAELV